MTPFLIKTLLAMASVASVANGVNVFQLDEGFLQLFGDNMQSLDFKTSQLNDSPVPQARLDAFRDNFMINLNYSGTNAIVAARSKEDPNYWYDWARDGALTMKTLMYVTDLPKAEQYNWYERYLGWVLNAHKQQGNPGFDIRGEPKFFVNGKLFDGPWGRNQNDGPALRAAVLIDYAQALIADGKTDYVVSKMYHADISEAAGIKFDLEYVAHNWRASTFDLWEEVSASHFFTMMVQRKSMIKGAALASVLGDQSAAEFYQQQVKDMSVALDQFYDSCKNNVMPTRDYGGGGTAANKEDMDAAVYLGALYGGMEGYAFSPLDERVLASVKHMSDKFGQEYLVNQKDDGKMPGRLFGRYPNDVYNGNGMSRGNPWVLTTAAAAEVHYANGNSHLEFLRSGKLLYVTYASKQFYLDLIPLVDSNSRDILQKRFETLPDPSCNVNDDLMRFSGGNTPSVVVSGDELLHLGQALMARGDEIMARLMTHVADDNELSEQINRDDGYLQGAKHLTWSYATVLAAMRTRNLYM